jgi:ribosomal protein L7/L12
MGTIKLTSYGSSLRKPVNINGFVLTSVYYQAEDIYLLDVISDLTYSDLYFEETDCQGNVYQDGSGRVRVKDDSESEYVAYSMLFYTNHEGTKKIVAVLTSDQHDYVISKKSDAINKFINLDLSVFQYGVSFSSYISGSRIATQNSDGLLHIDDPNTSIDDNYSIYTKSQVDALIADLKRQISGTVISVVAVGIPIYPNDVVPFRQLDNDINQLSIMHVHDDLGFPHVSSLITSNFVLVDSFLEKDNPLLSNNYLYTDVLQLDIALYVNNVDGAEFDGTLYDYGHSFSSDIKTVYIDPVGCRLFYSLDGGDNKELYYMYDEILDVPQYWCDTDSVYKTQSEVESNGYIMQVFDHYLVSYTSGRIQFIRSIMDIYSIKLTEAAGIVDNLPVVISKAPDKSIEKTIKMIEDASGFIVSKEVTFPEEIKPILAGYDTSSITKLQFVSAVRNIYGISVNDAASLVDSIPFEIVATNSTSSEELVDLLTDAGAIII